MRNFLLFFFILSPVYGETVLQLQEGGHEYDLTPYLFVFKEMPTTMTIQKIADPRFAEQFHQIKNGYPSFTDGDTAIWGRFTLQGDPARKQQWFVVFNYTQLESVEFFQKDGKGNYFRSIAGNLEPMQGEEFRSRKIIFPMMLEQPTETFYFRAISTDFPITLPVSITTIKGLVEKTQSEYIIHGIIFGILIGMFFYNFFIFLTLRDISYLYYIAHLFCLTSILAAKNGFVTGHIITNNAQLFVHLYNLTGSILPIFSIQFTRAFLDTKQQFPRLDKVWIGLIIFFVLNYFFWLFFREYSTPKSYALAAMISCIISIIFGFRYYKRYSHVRYFTHAWLVYLLTSIIFSLRSYDIIMPYLFEYLIEIGSVSEATLLSLALANRIRHFQDLAERDFLTGLHSRRSIQQIISNEIRKIQKGSQRANLSLVVIDIDNFKQINDRFGHNAGDVILKEFVSIIPPQLRRNDIMARWGGEEFILLLPETDARNGEAVSEKVRTIIEGHEFPFVEKMSASFGVAEYRGSESAREFFHRADRALYEAKQCGKNTVRLS